MRIYYIGLFKKNNNTVVLQATRNIDLLSPQTWKYFGERLTTKRALKDNKDQLLLAINQTYNTSFNSLIIQ